MNQNEQMREALRLANKSLKRWMPISWDRQAMDEYHQAISASEQALASEPAPLVRLTEEEIQLTITEYVQSGKCVWLGFKQDADGEFTVPFLTPLHHQLAAAIMDAMIAKNGGKV